MVRKRLKKLLTMMLIFFYMGCSSTTNSVKSDAIKPPDFPILLSYKNMTQADQDTLIEYANELQRYFDYLNMLAKAEKKGAKK